MAALDGTLEQIKDFFAGQKDVMLGYFYGSRAENCPRENSDLDIAVLLDDSGSSFAPYGRGVTLARQIEKIVVPVSVDVRELNAASPFFCFQVLKKGKLIYAKDENRRSEFESKISNKYFDLKFMYDTFSKDMAERLKGGTFGVRPAVVG